MRIALEQIRVASPCDMRWADLAPVADGRAVRHCARCGLNVHNLAAMTGDEIERLVLDSHGRLCARVRRRADGTLVTRDCPMGMRAVRQQAMRAVGRLAVAVIVLLAACVLMGGRTRGARARLKGLEPFATLTQWLNPIEYDTGGSIDLQAVLQAGQWSGGRSPFADDAE